jgi:hypothetical protein
MWVGDFRMRIAAPVLCLLFAGCAQALPPPPTPIEQNPYYQDIRRQLGIERAEQRQEVCTRLPKPAIGMMSAQVISSCWGKPDHAAESITAQGRQEVWSYPERYLYLSDGVVTKIVTSR